jgi:spore maturation protein CgeB
MRLYGGYWERYGELRRFWHGFVLGRDYRLALGCAKIAPCLVRRANRDGHVMRTFEITACGSFMLAERTEEHLELFEEGKEMACFGSPEELVDKVRYYLSHDKERQRIAEAGHRKATEARHTYQDRLERILQAVDSV